MDVTSVSLSEVLAASSTRAASLVPETSGYLALAIADASARLPFRLDDGLVALTTEGTVNVARGNVIVAPDESARRVRDVLSRLLATSIGSAPALASASRARNESADGVEGFIRELEAALVPVNRAAARRALARLARETVRAKESGKLRRRKVKRVVAEAALEGRVDAPVQAPIEVSVQAPIEVSVQAPIEVSVQAQVELPSVDVELSPAPEVAQETERPNEIAVSSEEPHIESEQPIALAQESETTDAAPTPMEVAAFAVDEAATTIDAAVMEGVRDEDLARAFEGSGRRSDLDDLLNRFAVSELSSADTIQQTRASLKRLAGLDPTPPPPSVEELKKMTQKPPAVTARIDIRPERSVKRSDVTRSKGSWGWLTVALVAAGLVLAGLLGHYLPQWLGDRSALLGWLA